MLHNCHIALALPHARGIAIAIEEQNMGELLQLYLGPDGKSPRSAFWLGMSRVVDPRPVISSALAAAVLAPQEDPVVDDWATVGAELHEAIEQVQSHGKQEESK